MIQQEVISYYLVSLLVAVVVAPSPVVPPQPPPITLPGCPRWCGAVEIPYPFGIGAECTWPGLGDFAITCNQSFAPPRPYSGNIEITSISLEAGEMRVVTVHSSICYSSPNEYSSDGGFNGNLAPPFLISPTRNVFTAIGCNTLAFLVGREDRSYYTGCISSCVSLEDAAQDGDNCTGLGCCQTSILGNLSVLNITWGNNIASRNPAWSYNPCSYTFVAEKDWYNFSRADLVGRNFARRVAGDGRRTIPLVLDWAIRSNGSCQMTAEGTLTAPACGSGNSICINVDDTRGGGYRCHCSAGYQGNPYVDGGCTDIDECTLRKEFPEVYGKMYHCGSATICRNTVGGYKCACKFGHVDDPKSEGGCRPVLPGYATAIVVAIVAGFVLALLVYFLVKEHQRRLRRGFFDKNGGEILKRMKIKTFTELELQKMTNNYSELIGKGHFGKVFRGTITDGDNQQQVAVKCPILVLDGSNKKKPPPPQQDNDGAGGEFVDEIIFQFMVSHANLVRLIGCCLETNVPCLVFEFISNGSLHNVLHGAGSWLSLKKRIDIAIGAAEAVSYMHSHGDHKHVHGDIKSANILLDGDLMPKVSDFGSAKLLSINMYAKAVAADRNYVDPVYMKTDRFTAKSDVYSFGVVLLELITRKTAMYDGNSSLPIDFVKCCKEEGNGKRMYDRDLLTGEDEAKSHVYIECLDRIGGLAVRCLKEDIDERPTMAEVVDELKQVKLRAAWR